METAELRKKESAKIRFIRQIRVPVLLIIIFPSAKIFAQAKNETFAITNYFTERYRDFSMMKISIVPPDGFAKDPDQVGFLDSKNSAAIRAEEIRKDIGAASADFFKGFDSTEHKDSLGMKLLDAYNFKINGFEAHLVNLSGIVDGDDYLQWWVFIGDNTNTYIVKSFIPAKKKKKLEQQVRAALLSVFYEPDRRLIPPGSDPTTTSASACGCHNQK